MKKEIKRWVMFLAPGAFVAEYWSRDIEHLDPARIEWPDNAYAFELYEREDMVDGETRYKGEPKQIGQTYYHPSSKIETLEQVRANPNKGSCLVSNMECNNWDRVIWTRWGNWPQPFDAAKMTVLSANPGIDARQADHTTKEAR